MQSIAPDNHVQKGDTGVDSGKNVARLEPEMRESTSITKTTTSAAFSQTGVLGFPYFAPGCTPLVHGLELPIKLPHFFQYALFTWFKESTRQTLASTFLIVRHFLVVIWNGPRDLL